MQPPRPDDVSNKLSQDTLDELGKIFQRRPDLLEKALADLKPIFPAGAGVLKRPKGVGRNGR